jgi:hypothetical protein
LSAVTQSTKEGHYVVVDVVDTTALIEAGGNFKVDASSPKEGLNVYLWTSREVGNYLGGNL